MQSLAMVSKCADMASHLSVPAVASLTRPPPVLVCLHNHEVVVGPDSLHVGLEMGVADDVLHPTRPPLGKTGSSRRSFVDDEKYSL